MVKSSRMSKILVAPAVVCLLFSILMSTLLMAKAEDPTNLIVGLTPQTVMLEKSETFTYTTYEQATYRTHSNGMTTVNNANDTDRTWFDLNTPALCSANVMGLLFDLGSGYNISSSTAIFPAQDASKGYVTQYTVYGGSAADNTILQNQILRVTNSGNSATMTGNTSTQGSSVRYILVVFDSVPTLQGVQGSMGDGTIYISELKVLGTTQATTTEAPTTTTTEAPTTTTEVPTTTTATTEATTVPAPAPSSIIAGLTPQTVMLDKSDTFTYTAFEQTSFRTHTNGVAVANNANDTDRTWFDINNSPDRVTHVMGLLYDLGGNYTVASSTAIFPAQDASKGYVTQYTVYGGSAANNTILQNQILRVTNSGNSATMTGNASTQGSSVRYILVVFDSVPTVEGVQGSMGNGTIYISELKVFETTQTTTSPSSTASTSESTTSSTTTSTTAPTTPPVNVGSNLILGKVGKMISFDHELDWKLQTPFTYSASALKINNELTINQGGVGWTDGAFDRTGGEATTPYAIDNSSGMYTRRIGVLYDLGGYYDLNKTSLYVSDKDINDKRYLLGVSVYGGPVADATLLSNRIGFGGGTTGRVDINVATSTSVRYVMVVFDKLGTDNWCDQDHLSHTAACVPVEGADKYCAYTNGAVHMTEVEIYGEEGEDPTSEVNYTDTKTDVTVNVLTYNNPAAVDSIRITTKALTDSQKKAVEGFAMFAPNGLYQIDFLDKDGNVITDMSGRQVTISVPFVNGDECLAYYTEEDGLVVLDSEIDTANNLIVYTCEENQVFSEYLLLTMTAPDSDTDTNDTNATTDTDVTDDGGKNVDTGVAFPVSIMGLVAISTIAAVISRKRYLF